MSASASTEIATEVILPGEKTLVYAARIAIEQDKPIMLDYYMDTREGKAVIGEDKVSKEKMLVRSEDEYTSLIQKILRVGSDFLILTENSIYIVPDSIKKKFINTPA